LEYHRNCKVVLGTVLLQQQWNRYIMCEFMHNLPALLRIRHPLDLVGIIIPIRDLFCHDPVSLLL
jgi:hypothetical protein